MRKKIAFFVLLLAILSLTVPAANPWSSLKKIYIYDSLKDYDHVLEHLQQIEFDGLKRADRSELAEKFINLGDNYYAQKRYRLAESFYRKVIPVSPDYWYVYNKLERINRDQGGFLFNFRNIFQQVSMVLKDFEASFFLVDNFFNILFFSSLLILFLQAIILFIKYFRLAGDDLLKDENNLFSLKKMIFLAAILFWPIIFLSGWIVYPFLVFGFLWVYLSTGERKAVIFIIAIVAVVSVLYSFNHVLEKNFRTQDFQTIKQVFDGHLFERSAFETFDNELKVLQALSYYERGDLKTAEDILNMTGEDYKSTLKFNLLGLINYRFENITESIKYFRMCLSLDDGNRIALNNFTMALLKNDNQEVFDSWAKRYTEISEYKKNKLQLQDVELNQRFLWRRLLSLPDSRLSLLAVFKNVIGSILTTPVFYCLLLFLGYIFFIPRLFSDIGESTYCSKCAKIIKETTVHKSYKLCNECYQLFLIKDVIFLEAKILKEKELTKGARKRSLILWIVSLFIPGMKLNYLKKNRMFIMLCGMFFFILGYFFVGTGVMMKVFGTSPIFLNFIGVLAMVIYFVANVYALRGDEDGV